jgi:hypothetical protein
MRAMQPVFRRPTKTQRLLQSFSAVEIRAERWLREFGQFVEWKSWGVSRP